MKINLGCGLVPREGYINVDSRQLDGVDQVVDLNKLPWPWPDDSVDVFLAEDCLEHLYPLGKGEGQYNIVAVLKEIWRTLKLDGELKARIPTTDGPGAWQDPTHVTYWNLQTWFYFSKHAGGAWNNPDYPKFDVCVNMLHRKQVIEGPDIVWMEVQAIKK